VHGRPLQRDFVARQPWQACRAREDGSFILWCCQTCRRSVSLDSLMLRSGRGFMVDTCVRTLDHNLCIGRPDVGSVLSGGDVNALFADSWRCSRKRSI